MYKVLMMLVVLVVVSFGSTVENYIPSEITSLHTVLTEHSSDFTFSARNRLKRELNATIDNWISQLNFDIQVLEQNIMLTPTYFQLREVRELLISYKL